MISSNIEETTDQQIAYENLCPEIISYLSNSASENTIRAREADLRVFLDWGGHLPSTEEEVATFLAQMASNRKHATLSRYISTLNHWHGAKRLPSPCKCELVRAVMSGIARTNGRGQKRAKPLVVEHIKILLDSINGDHMADHRDRALISVGFAGAFRRSELTAIHTDALEFVIEGVRIKLPRSKTDQVGQGQIKAIPYAKKDPHYCPVGLLKAWIHTSKIQNGPIFRRVMTNGAIGTKALHSDSFYVILKKRLEKAGINEELISPHSLRAGLITSAFIAGKDRFKTKQISGHKDDRTFEKYIRDSDLYRDNAADLF